MVKNVSRLKMKASLERVWECLTVPELVKRWQYGSELTTTWEPHSPIRFKTVWQDSVFEQWGSVLEFRPMERIRYSLFAPRPGLEDRPENHFTMVYSLKAESGQVFLELAQEDPRTGAVQEADQGEENPVLAELKKVAEQG